MLVSTDGRQEGEEEAAAEETTTTTRGNDAPFERNVRAIVAVL